MSDALELKLPSRPNFMVVEGRTYLVEKVEQAPVDMLKHVEQYYEDSLTQMRERVALHVSQASQEDLNAQVMRIERHLTSGVVSIPDTIRACRVLGYKNNRIYETRIVLFRPHRISCTLQKVNNYAYNINSMALRDKERYKKFMEWAVPLNEHYRGLGTDVSNVKVDIIFEQDLVIEAMAVMYVADENKIYCYPENKHPHVHSSNGELCTGGAYARTFWDDPAFKDNFNGLNPHSWANGGTTAASNCITFLKNQYFTGASVREESDAWMV